MNIRTEFYELKACWKSRAKRTTNEMPELTPFELSEADGKMSEEIGMVGDSLKVVNTEDAVERLKSERRIQNELRSKLAAVTTQREKCQFEGNE